MFDQRLTAASRSSPASRSRASSTSRPSSRSASSAGSRRASILHLAYTWLTAGLRLLCACFTSRPSSKSAHLHLVYTWFTPGLQAHAGQSGWIRAGRPTPALRTLVKYWSNTAAHLPCAAAASIRTWFTPGLHLTRTPRASPVRCNVGRTGASRLLFT